MSACAHLALKYPDCFVFFMQSRPSFGQRNCLHAEHGDSHPPNEATLYETTGRILDSRLNWSARMKSFHWSVPEPDQSQESRGTTVNTAVVLGSAEPRRLSINRLRSPVGLKAPTEAAPPEKSLIFVYWIKPAARFRLWANGRELETEPIQEGGLKRRRSRELSISLAHCCFRLPALPRRSRNTEPRIR